MMRTKSLSLAGDSVRMTAAVDCEVTIVDAEERSPQVVAAIERWHVEHPDHPIRLVASVAVVPAARCRLGISTDSGAQRMSVIRETPTRVAVEPTVWSDERQIIVLDVGPGVEELIHVILHDVEVDLGELSRRLAEPTATPQAPGYAERGAAETPVEGQVRAFPAPPGGGGYVSYSYDRLERADEGAGGLWNVDGGAYAGPVPDAGHAAREAAGPEVEFAQVGASMPRIAELGQPVTVTVRLSRGVVRVTEGTSHDERVIVVRPDRDVTVTLVRTGFTLDPGENGFREIPIPAIGAPEAVEEFRLRAAVPGAAEVQVVVRQEDPQPIAVLRLRCTIQEEPVPGDDPMSLPDEHVAEIARTIDPFLAPRTLTVDEDLIGGRATLTFELVLPGFRRRYPSVEVDKAAVLADLYTEIEAAWDEFDQLESPRRTVAFRDRLRACGSRLARAVLPGELLDFLRMHPEEFGELTILTSAETDIPWELVYAWNDLRGVDQHDEGFLGRAGLVRWIYCTGHPKAIRVRSGAARYLIPSYADPAIALSEAALEFEYLDPFGATAIMPGTADEIAAVLRGGELDLLHFAGHGLTDEQESPPLHQLALANYRRSAELDAGPTGDEPDPRTVGYSLTELRRDLRDEPPFSLTEPGPLVVLNACRLGRAPTHGSEQGGFAEAFLRGGAGAFVGCLWSIGDQPGRAFVEEFYTSLRQGYSMSSATIRARQAARRSGDSSWLAYTVYAHPDARVLIDPQPALPSIPSRRSDPTTVAHTKGAIMTDTTSSGARGSSNLTPDQLRALHPHVVSIRDGRLGSGDSELPTSDRDFKTVPADLDALFEVHLPRFIAASAHDGPVPLVLWAHGGLVDKGAGLRIAHSQAAWWKSNGAYPVHFVWETGLASSLWDAVKDALPGRPRSMDDFFDGIIEDAVRFANGAAVWSAMKTVAEDASKPRSGGAWQFAERLAAFMAANPKAITVHAVGHSAGSIFLSHLLPAAFERGVPNVSSLSLLAPAVRVDTFKRRLVPVLDRIDSLAMFTMSKTFELDDSCIGIYQKSLLYLIRAALEQESRAAILGLQECVRDDAQLSALFGTAGSGAPAEVVWSRTVGGGPTTSSQASTHGGFDGDGETMNSVARRVVGRRFTTPWSRPRALDGDLWPSADEVFAYVAAKHPSGADTTAGGRRRALCIGIDTYPTAPLKGCVSDAERWTKVLTAAGFKVETLHNEQATRAAMVDRIQNLIVSSRPGDVLALQFSGHGTTVEDLDGDEAVEDGDGRLRDEALCPYDFDDGELLIDDDLGALWDLLPEDVSLTIFFDSCHSGGGQREVFGREVAEDSRTRYVSLRRSTIDAYIAKRGAMVPSTSRDNERSVFFGACLQDQPAYESDHRTEDGLITGGDFTALAIPRLASAIGASTNEEFYDAVLAAFGEDRRQTPVLKPPSLKSRTLLAGSTAAGPVPTVVEPAESKQVPVVLSPVPVSHDGGPTDRDRAVAEFLHATAKLIVT